MPRTQRGDTSWIWESLWVSRARQAKARQTGGVRTGLLACLLMLGAVGKPGLAASGPFPACLYPAASTIKPLSPAALSLSGGKIPRSRADDGVFRRRLVVRSQGAYQGDDEEQFTEPRTDELDRITQALHDYGRILVKVGVVLLGIVVLKIINPINLYYNAGDRALRRAVRNVDDLLKKIREEAETVSADAETETDAEEEESLDGGLLAGMTEIIEMSNGQDVPAYVLTVNDMQLDDVRITLKRLRRFRDASADKYKKGMFSVITGIKTISEQSTAAGIGSGLAVDIKAYFEDEGRYHAWEKTLAPYARRGEYQEAAQGFLLFMKNHGAEKPLTPPQRSAAPPAPSSTPSLEDTALEIPDVISEETLPRFQQAAIEEARNLCTQVRRNDHPNGDGAWQFALVARQQQAYLRKETQRMLMVFLNCERKAWQRITKSKMLPCRTWEHVLYVLGVKSGNQLLERIDNRLLTLQEIAILEKAFLQTFAKKDSLRRVYGSNQSAQVMVDLHIPQIRQKSLVSLRRLQQTDPVQLDKATAGLNQEETPRQNEVKRLIRHYVHHRHAPPGLSRL